MVFELIAAMADSANDHQLLGHGQDGCSCGAKWIVGQSIRESYGKHLVDVAYERAQPGMARRAIEKHTRGKVPWLDEDYNSDYYRRT